MNLKEKIPAWPRLKKLISFGILTMVLLGMASFADKQHKDLVCSQINVGIKDEKECQFVNRKAVLHAIAATGADDMMGRKVNDIDLKYIETRVSQNSFVKDVTAWFDMKGVLNIDLHQRIPLIRVLNPANESFYIDVEGKKMPLSDEYTALVPMVTSSYNIEPRKAEARFKALDSSIFVLGNFLKKDSFARALTGQIIIMPNNDFEIIPRLGNFQIVLGDASDLENKFLRLKSFYRVTLPEKGWDTYKQIILKYRNQIIANR